MDTGRQDSSANCLIQMEVRVSHRPGRQQQTNQRQLGWEDGGEAKERLSRLWGDKRPHLQCLVMEVGEGEEMGDERDGSHR
ncbi:hypothetical protein FQA47_019314 [Oryzias melastigma]|uniref:Uncharacterized protein n=1 Tax=Oryzias melastigma TaxID=30732 RepID=A0A834BW05_ORYME|nr:hypothetical protein FQA47_019314 [Oryzias melastigma]